MFNIETDIYILVNIPNLRKVAVLYQPKCFIAIHYICLTQIFVKPPNTTAPTLCALQLHEFVMGYLTVLTEEMKLDVVVGLSDLCRHIVY